MNLSKEGKDAYGQMAGVLVYSVRDSLIKQWSHKITLNSDSGKILPGKAYSFLATAPFPIKSYQASLEGVQLSWDKNTIGGLLRGCTGSVISVDSIEVTPMYLLGSDRMINSKKFCSPDRPTVIAADGTEEIARPAFFHIQCPESVVKQKNTLFG